MEPRKIVENAAQYWDLTGTLPFPRFVPTCPFCGQRDFVARSWLPFDRGATSGRSDHRISHRIDVSLVCYNCGWAASAGIPVSREFAERLCEFGQIEMGGTITVYALDEDPKSTHAAWDFSKVLPVPKFDPMCAYCSQKNHMIRAWACWNDHIVVSFKCLECGLVSYADIWSDEAMVKRVLDFTAAEMGQDIPWQAGKALGIRWSQVDI